MAKKFVLGLDFGTNSVRALVVDARTGEEIATAVANYTSGENGVIYDKRDDLVARQHPRDWLKSMSKAANAAVKKARRMGRGFSAEGLIGIGVDTTGSTPLPLDKKGMPIAFLAEFSTNPNACAWLWKDHSSWAEAEEITKVAREIRPGYIQMYGGAYSSEWFWSKIVHCLRTAPRVFTAAYTWAEASDWIPALLTSNTSPEQMKRNICAAGHKAMFHHAWAGYPDREFLSKFSPALIGFRNHLPNVAFPSSEPAGFLSKEWARKFGVKPGIPVAVGGFDAHFGAVGSGIKPERLVKIIGTSTCDMMVVPKSYRLKGIPGIPGVVEDSIIPGMIGIEAGQSAVGDIFNWFVSRVGPLGMSHEELTKQAQELRPGQSGLVALDWNNGNRSVLMDQTLSGLLMGQTLLTSPAEIYRALIEATAFGARVIIDRLEKHRLKVEEVVCCGGISEKNEMLLQIYADVLGRPIRLTRSTEACALGAAVFAAVAAGSDAGGYATAEEAQKKMCHLRDKGFQPKADNQAVYEELYKIYLALHNALGGVEKRSELGWIMKKLFESKKRANSL